MARPALGYNVVTATLKLERANMERFEAYLKSTKSDYHTKNSYIVNTVDSIVQNINTGDNAAKAEFVLQLLPFATPRKQIKSTDASACKCAVVSVKLREETHETAVNIAQSLGFSFSDMVRRCILRDVTMAGF